MSNDNYVFSQVCQTMLYWKRLAKNASSEEWRWGGHGVALMFIQQYKSVSRTKPALSFLR